MNPNNDDKKAKTFGWKPFWKYIEPVLEERMTRNFTVAGLSPSAYSQLSLKN